jgi:hypothetical protein
MPNSKYFCRRILPSQQTQATPRTFCYVRSAVKNCEDKSRKQNGNALWLILIVVALFGALTATLSRNTGTVNQAGDVEQSRIRATNLLRYSTAIETTIQNMIMGGISENDLDFSSISDDYENENCSDNSCNIFKAQGGGIPYRSLSDVLGKSISQDWIVSAQNTVYLAGCDDLDNTCTDLLLIAPSIPKDVCLQINDIQGIANTDGNPPQMDNIMMSEVYNGSFTSDINGSAIGGENASTEAPEVQGHNAACVETNETYAFYQVLLAR